MKTIRFHALRFLHWGSLSSVIVASACNPLTPSESTSHFDVNFHPGVEVTSTPTPDSTPTPVTAPTLTSLSISNSTPTLLSSFSLSFVGAASYSDYCLNVNDINVSDCSWVTGTTLPASLTISSGDGNKTLTAWLRNSAGTVSTAVSSNTVYLDQTSPTVSITTPTTGTIWAGGASKNVAFTAADANALATLPVSLDYSTNGGTTWTTGPHGLSGISPYVWTVPSVNSSSVKIRLTVTDAAGNTAITLSNAFQIDSTAPLSATSAAWSETSPHGGSSITATWTKSSSSDLTNQTLQFYSDSSCSTTTGSVVDLASSNTQTYAWTPSSSGTYSFKLTSLDAAGNSTTSTCSGGMVLSTDPNTTGMVLQLEASKADGSAPYANGCAAGGSTWDDLSSYLNNATLTFAGSCSSSDAWQGLNTLASPKRLLFNGNFSTTTVAPSGSINDIGPSSFTLWIYRDTTAPGVFLYKSDNNGSAGWWFDITTISYTGFGFSVVSSGTNLRRYTSVTPPVGSWVHVAATWDGTLNSSGTHVYMNGTEVTYDARDTTGTGSHSTDIAETLYIGDGASGTNHYFVGSIGNVIIYNRVLTGTEIRVNCESQQAHYNVTTCAP